MAIALAARPGGGDHPAMADDERPRTRVTNPHPALFEVRTAVDNAWACLACNHVNVDERRTCSHCGEYRPSSPRRDDR